MRLIRGQIICREMSWKVPAEEFRKHSYGWARTEVIKDLLKELGVEVSEYGSAQVIPIDRDYLIVLREQ